MCVGKATKLVQDIEGYSKVYLAGFELGYQTDTYDIEGNTINTSDKNTVSIDRIRNSY